MTGQRGLPLNSSAKPGKSARKTKNVSAMPGLGPKSTRALAAIGIHSLEELRSRDPYAVYRRLKESIPGTSLNFMYGLIGAIQGRHWREVRRADRTDILLRLDQMGLAPK